jgi:dynamin 1-like protein
LQILSNNVIPLKKGYVAVMNRSQKDIQENLPIRQGLAKEHAFFQSHPKYRNIMSQCGTKNLARTLSKILMVHIRDCLPDIKTKINKLLVGVQQNLDDLGDSIDDQNAASKGAALLRILAQFAKNFSNKIDGKAVHQDFNSNEVNELHGGARISYIFNEIFGKTLQNIDPFEGLEDDDIRTAIANANGVRPALFVPEIAFDHLVRRQIQRLEDPGQRCLDLVVDELQKIISQSETVELHRFPDLRDRTIDCVYHLLKSCISPANKMIANLIQIELAYINTSHPDFIGGKAAAGLAHQSRVKQQAAASAAVLNGSANNSNGELLPPAVSAPSSTAASGERGFQGVFSSAARAPSKVPTRSNFNDDRSDRLPSVSVVVVVVVVVFVNCCPISLYCCRCCP